MIWGKWIDPNFKFRAFDREGAKYEHFCYADSEHSLRLRLQERNLTVGLILTFDFGDWKARARRATERTIHEYHAGKRPINFNTKIWAELKWHLFELFHGKCAYCEGKVQAVAFGDVEHFRPKSKVDEDRNHPGYYWLAYDETNLLPSCGPCNQARGKMTHFPVCGQHACNREEIKSEQPLLLNPYNREIDPFDHLTFDSLGTALPHNNSLHGEQSTKWYHLNRPGLSEARRAAVTQVHRDWNALIAIFSNMEGAHTLFRHEITLGKREYSAAQKWHLDRIYNCHLPPSRSAPPNSLAAP